MSSSRCRVEGTIGKSTAVDCWDKMATALCHVPQGRLSFGRSYAACSIRFHIDSSDESSGHSPLVPPGQPGRPWFSDSMAAKGSGAIQHACLRSENASLWRPRIQIARR